MGKRHAVAMRRYGATVSEDLVGNVTSAQSDATSGGSLDILNPNAPLAVRLRPRTIDEIVGQQHLLTPGSPLRRLAEGTGAMSVFLWGPPGVGKTTIASVVSHATNRRFVEISAVTAGVKDVRRELETARRQDVLLPAVENRTVTLIAATTENPSFSVISPLLSRSLLLTLKPLTEADVSSLLDRALSDPRGLRTESDGFYVLEDDARADLLQLAGGDARRALTYLEEAAAGASAAGTVTITSQIVSTAVDRAAVRYDRAGDQHYDVISAFIKSVRGSDVDAALHYLARMIEAGEDPRFIARRLVILASEDIGMAAPSVLQTCIAAAQAVQLIGMPEARLSLAQAAIAAATAPKSNAIVTAIDGALADVRAGKGGEVPAHLRDAHYSSAHDLGHGVGYRYAHNFPHGVAEQQYLPDDIASARYYDPTDHGNEAAISQRLSQLRVLLGRDTEEKKS